VIDFKGGLVHTQVFDSVFKLVEKDLTRGVWVFGADAIWQNKVPEDTFGNILTPTEKTSGFKGSPDLTQEVLTIEVSQIAQGHEGIEKFQCFFFLKSQGLIHHLEKFVASACSLFHPL